MASPLFNLKRTFSLRGRVSIQLANKGLAGLGLPKTRESGPEVIGTARRLRKASCAGCFYGHLWFASEFFFNNCVWVLFFNIG